MGIVRLCDANTPGAVKGESGGSTFYTVTEYEGCVLKEWENNGYDDSDFYCSYWDEEAQEIKTTIFASTRGWSYPCLATRVDATPEVRAKADAWIAKRERERRVRTALAGRNRAREIARKLDLPNYHRVVRLAKAYNVHGRIPSELHSTLLDGEKSLVHRVFDLIQSYANNRLRSKFRKSLAEQIVRWMRDDSPTYDRPLSAKQESFL